MSTSSSKRVSEWLRATRPETETQEALAADITRVTGWHITRDRYSKYESGSLPIGKVVKGHFVDYWATRDVAGPDETPPPVIVPPDPQMQLIAALTAQTKAINELVSRLDFLAPSAIRAGVADALREAGLNPTDGESPDEPPLGLSR